MLDRPGQVLRQGLSGLAERQKLIANNLANVETPGYRPQDISFERVLGREMQGTGGIVLASTSPAHMAGPSALGNGLSMDSGMVAPIELGEPGLDVDAEMAKLSETVIEYNAVAQLVAARLSLLRAAVTEGKR